MRRSRALALAGGLAAALAGGLALYAAYPRGNAGTVAANPCEGARPASARVEAAARGEVAAMQGVPPRPAPDLAFLDAKGETVRLADLRGRLLLVNLWATWCAPCKAEMPALDALQGALGGPDFQVVALNVDTRNLDRPPQWLRDNGVARLAYFADPGGRAIPAVQRDTGSTGLPTTFLVDAGGCTIGVMKGPAAWSSPDGERLIRAALGRES